MNMVSCLLLVASLIPEIISSSGNFRRDRFMKHHARGKIQKRSYPEVTNVPFDKLTWKIEYYRKLQKIVGRHDPHLINHYYSKFISNGALN